VRTIRLIFAAAAVTAVCGCATSGGEGPRPPDRAAVPAQAEPPAEFGRNVVRVGGRSPADVTAAALLGAYGSAGIRPDGWVMAQREAWAEQVVAAQFAAPPVDAAVMPVEADRLTLAASDAIERIVLNGFSSGKGLEAIVLGDGGNDLFADISSGGLEVSQLAADSSAQLSFDAVPFRGGFAGEHSTSVVVVAAKARDYALPAAAWSAYSGDTVAFVDRDEVPVATRELLEQRAKLTLEKPSIYVVGPVTVVSDDVERTLRRYGTVERIAGRDAVETAVEFARYRDPRTGFGWGLETGPASVVLMNLRHADDLPAALALAAHGPRAPLLLTEDPDRLPRAVEAYLRTVRTDVPGQAFALGDSDRFSTGLLRRVDWLMSAEKTA
jgi:hypothetical protein